MRASLVIIVAAITGGVVVSSCGNDVSCANGTHLENSSCVPNDAGVEDLGGSTTCGTNTVASNGSCTVAASACGPGTVFDPGTSTCQLPGSHGTMVWQSTLTTTWDTMAMKISDADAGDSYQPVGTPGALPAGTNPATKLFMYNGDPMGQLTNIPVSWFNGSTGTVGTFIDHQFTVGEWQKCKGSWELYKDPPSGKKTYNVVVRMSGCPVGTLFSVWHFFSTTDKLDDLYLGTPLGGTPNYIQIDKDGNGYFERELDPNVWFKMDTALPGAWHGPSGQTATIPNTTAFPNATFYVDIAYHNGGQSNGNAGMTHESFCVRDNTNACVDPPAPNIYLPGELGVDWGGLLTGAGTADGPTTTKPIPIGMVQPY